MSRRYNHLRFADAISPTGERLGFMEWLRCRGGCPAVSNSSESTGREQVRAAKDATGVGSNFSVHGTPLPPKAPGG